MGQGSDRSRARDVVRGRPANSKAKTTLGEHVGLAERILTLAELARKLETEAEKVAPFYSSSANDAAADAQAVEAAAAH